MPTPFTSTFASAAASSNGENSNNRRDGTGAGDWSRHRPNGATQTFRRPSSSTMHTQARESAPPATAQSSSGVYIPPHLNASYSAANTRNGVSGDARYNKDQLLGIFQNLRENGILDGNLEEVFLGSWNPLETKNGINSRNDTKDPSSNPEICWNYANDLEPFGLVGMNEEEKQLFSSSVNSPLKLNQPSAKETNAAGPIGTRKSSLSGYGGLSNSARPSTRRREPSDSFSANGPLSPSESKSFFRNESNTATPPSGLLRRRTDLRDEDPSTDPKEEEAGPDEGNESQTSFAPLRRSGTAPVSAGLNQSPSSPWSAAPQSSGFGSMGNFGSFAIGSTNPGQESNEKRPGFGSARGTSRFKDLLNKNSSEDIPATKDKGAFAALEKLPEEEMDSSQAKFRELFKTRPNRSETNPYEETTSGPGNASIGTPQEAIPPTQGIEHLGFTSFGAASNIGARDFGLGENISQNTPHTRFNKQEPMSPTNTNPYQSPQGMPNDDEDRDPNESTAQPSGLSSFAGNRRNFFGGIEDRNVGSGTTQRNASGFGGASGFGALGVSPNWPTAGLSSGGPGRERSMGSSAFGDQIFNPLPDLQSPPSASAGGGIFGPNAFGSAGRSSRLGAMFPPAMQEQMGGDGRNEMQHVPFESRPESGQQNTSARDPFRGVSRRQDDSFLRGGNPFGEGATPAGIDDIVSQYNQSGQNAVPNSVSTPGVGQRGSTGTDLGQPGHGLSQSSGSSSSNQMPAAQQRQMVMPDRMRWIYRDPQGNTQGPWSGLEMHDWFKAGFFTAELQVKKLEDSEYEPLAQLVRRIGNSREPFLVPQIGVPHGQPTSGQGNHWANSTMGGAGPTGNAQPPFASSFPSFGTTLTAEQQNALERRKQEEQFLMARQKEHLAQQQVLMKQMQMQNGPHGLHSLQHHSSAHSLQSQPSFGSMTSPSNYQASSAQAPIQPPHHGQTFGQHPGSNLNLQQNFGGESRTNRDDELHNLMGGMSFSQRANFPFGMPALPTSNEHGGPSTQQIASMLQDRARLQQQQQQQPDLRSPQETFLGQQGRNDRLEEFHDLRGQLEAQSGRPGLVSNLPLLAENSHMALDNDIGSTDLSQSGALGHRGAIQKTAPVIAEGENLSLAQQVFRTAAANQQAADETDVYKIDDLSTQPPPVSISPLPAPAAQRNRQHVADALAAESRSAVQTPVEAPGMSIAPWAERPVEMPKGPSLKEIQEAEAKRAAEQEEIAATARRAQAEQDRLAQIHVPPPAPGLPSTSTWGASSPGASTPTGSVWSKQGSVKTVGSTATGSAKKTLAQIQKEEESRKQRAAAAAAAAQAQIGGSQTTASAGKRYAELTGKLVPTASSSSPSAWTTVGSGGKTKPPATVIATPVTATRTVSTSSTTTAGKPRPTLQPTRSTNPSNQSKATEEFTKWIRGSLGKGLNSNINLDNFIQDLLILPPEIEIISDSIYASSQTLDGRRFAEEFVRRRRLADRGVVEPASNGLQAAGTTDNKSSGGGGWNEVAKKGPATAAKEESGGNNNAPFKVVATKKKSKR